MLHSSIGLYRVTDVFDRDFKPRLFYQMPKSCTKFKITSEGKTIIFPLFSDNKYFRMDTTL